MKHSNHNYNPVLKDYAHELRTETVSRAEKFIWQKVLSRNQQGVKFKRQRPIDRFIVDFCCQELNLIIEIDGNSHYHKPEYDAYRQKRLEDLGFTIVRFSEGEVLNNIGNVITQLQHVILCLNE
jgi:very-short-patch-repair endonuclease